MTRKVGNDFGIAQGEFIGMFKLDDVLAKIERVTKVPELNIQKYIQVHKVFPQHIKTYTKLGLTA